MLELCGVDTPEILPQNDIAFRFVLNEVAMPRLFLGRVGVPAPVGTSFFPERKPSFAAIGARAFWSVFGKFCPVCDPGAALSPFADPSKREEQLGLGYELSLVSSRVSRVGDPGLAAA
jgi:hypothetical protein